MLTLQLPYEKNCPLQVHGPISDALDKINKLNLIRAITQNLKDALLPLIGQTFQEANEDDLQKERATLNCKYEIITCITIFHCTLRHNCVIL